MNKRTTLLVWSRLHFISAPDIISCQHKQIYTLVLSSLMKKPALPIVLLMLVMGCTEISEEARKPAEKTANTFLSYLQQHQYARAGALIPNVQETTSVTEKQLEYWLRANVEGFERSHGAIQAWTIDNWWVHAGDDSVISFKYIIRGSKQGTRSISLQLEPIKGTWQIAEVVFWE